MKRFGTIVILLSILFADGVRADGVDYSKMSAFVRSIAMQQKQDSRKNIGMARVRNLCAFVRLTGNADSTLTAYGCRTLADYGDIRIASIPLEALRGLSLSRNVTRIETGRSHTALMDRSPEKVNATPVYDGEGLPRAYTGRGVVMGIMDIGFDLTHPNFYDATGRNYRIQRLWDQLSADTVGSGMYVGAEYIGRDRLLEYRHCRDGLRQTHGTHTLGIAAGSGYDSPYRGIAYESDICLVSNAVTDDREFIADDDLYKYTYATDALGFQYIFDYATAQGQPCVISFSEGSHQDFRGDDQLFYEVLDRITGPGRIIVSSAGNNGHLRTYIGKPAGQPTAGSGLMSVNTADNSVFFTVKGREDSKVRVVAAKGSRRDTVTFRLGDIADCENGERTDIVALGGVMAKVDMTAYKSCYDTKETVCDFSWKGFPTMFDNMQCSVELVGEAEAELFLMTGQFYAIDNESGRLRDALCTHNINSPSSAPSVICVGATCHRLEIINDRGETQPFYDLSDDGGKSMYSSVGPTYDGRIKPDVMAPGINVISSFSRYWLEKNPDTWDADFVVSHSEFGGHSYPWAACSGTSMASPIVGGAVALWLEACPTLTPQDVLGVISRTSRHLDDTPVPNNEWGYGEIDVYRGLLDVLGLNSIDGLPTHRPQAVRILPAGRNSLRVCFGSAPKGPVTLRVYSINGSLVTECRLEENKEEVEVSLPVTPGAVYAVQIKATDSRFCGSELVRF